MRRHCYPHGRSTGGIRVHNGIRIRIRKVKAVPVADVEFIRNGILPLVQLVVIVNRTSACSRAKSPRLREIIGLIAYSNGSCIHFNGKDFI